MSIQIEVVKATQTTNPTKTPGKTYQALEIAYKNLSFGNKIEGRKIMSFGATADTFKVLAVSQPGEVFTIEIVKNDAGFNDWVSAVKANGVVVVTPSDAPAYNKTPGTGTSTPKSTYETPEERAKKQILIVRQSSVSSAVDLLSIGSKTSVKVSDVIDTAKVIESYVFGDTTTVVDSGIATIKDSEFDDVPL